MSFLLGLSIFTVIFWTIVFIDAYIGMKSVKKIEHYPPSKENKKISVIIAARNEEIDILNSITSQIKQSYANIEWIVVNDRSTDRTEEIINTLASNDTRITPLHITELPSHWLGKNHALYQGYLKSTGEYLLFTDADVYFEKEAFTKAISFLENEKIDHLTIAPNMNVKGFWLQAFVSFFLFGFSYFKRPWAANNDRSKQGIGIGAFNLITREAYEKIGTHKAISLRPDDDLQLGIKVKEFSLKSRIASALTLVHVQWYRTLTEAIAGLEKNTFAGLHYRYSMVCLAIFGVFLSQAWPFIAVVLFGGIIQLFYALSILVIFVLFVLTSKRFSALPIYLFLVFPLTALLFIYTITRAVLLTAIRGGIVWRGTFYTLKEMRKK